MPTKRERIKVVKKGREPEKEREKIKNQLHVNAGRDEAYFIGLESPNHQAFCPGPNAKVTLVDVEEIRL